MITDADRKNYSIHQTGDPSKANIAGQLASLPLGTTLTDCFGTSFVISNGKEEKPKREAIGLGNYASGYTPCG